MSVCLPADTHAAVRLSGMALFKLRHRVRLVNIKTNLPLVWRGQSDKIDRLKQQFNHLKGLFDFCQFREKAPRFNSDSVSFHPSIWYGYRTVKVGLLNTWKPPQTSSKTWRCWSGPALHLQHNNTKKINVTWYWDNNRHLTQTLHFISTKTKTNLIIQFDTETSL